MKLADICHPAPKPEYVGKLFLAFKSTLGNILTFVIEHGNGHLPESTIFLAAGIYSYSENRWIKLPNYCNELVGAPALNSLNATFFTSQGLSMHLAESRDIHVHHRGLLIKRLICSAQLRLAMSNSAAMRLDAEILIRYFEERIGVTEAEIERIHQWALHAGEYEDVISSMSKTAMFETQICK